MKIGQLIEYNNMKNIFLEKPLKNIMEKLFQHFFLYN